MKSPPAPDLDEGAPKGTLGDVWAFLNRDVSTFRWWRQNKAGTEADAAPRPGANSLTATPKEPLPEVVSEVDDRQIEGLRFRRELLDWRDEFHYQVTETAFQGMRSLAEQVESELANMSFLRLRLFTKPASEVLERHIEACVRSPMRHTTQIEQATLRQRHLAWFPQQEPATIWVVWPKLEWDSRLGLKFTADNQAQILTALGELLLGENGLADLHRQWATRYAGQILEMRHAQPDSV
jgi:hypothetical protein